MLEQITGMALKTEIENLKLFNNVHSDFAQYFIYSTIEFEVGYFTMDRK